ncbi:hypothetical protein [Candidatus Brocadia sapporoensis]|nr:hypothetical protein [Candidatus Brocadia sapporoensis]
MAIFQVIIVFVSGSVAHLLDTIHNYGDPSVSRFHAEVIYPHESEYFH